MLAAIFSSYGNGTRLDRFIPVSKALLKKKKLNGMHACMQVPSSIVGVESISYRSAFLSSPVVSAVFVVYPSHSSSLFSPKSIFYRQRAEIFKKVCLFLGVGGSLAERLVDGVGSQ